MWLFNRSQPRTRTSSPPPPQEGFKPGDNVFITTSVKVFAAKVIAEDQGIDPLRGRGKKYIVHAENDELLSVGADSLTPDTRESGQLKKESE